MDTGKIQSEIQPHHRRGSSRQQEQNTYNFAELHTVCIQHTKLPVFLTYEIQSIILRLDTLCERKSIRGNLQGLARTLHATHCGRKT